jgi:hypothetical protein
MKAKKVVAYECPECGSLYEEENDARDCCYSIEPLDAWECGECFSLYTDKDEAKECCK